MNDDRGPRSPFPFFGKGGLGFPASGGSRSSHSRIARGSIAIERPSQTRAIGESNRREQHSQARRERENRVDRRRVGRDRRARGDIALDPVARALDQFAVMHARGAGGLARRGTRGTSPDDAPRPSRDRAGLPRATSSDRYGRAANPSRPASAHRSGRPPGRARNARNRRAVRNRRRREPVRRVWRCSRPSDSPDEASGVEDSGRVETRLEPAHQLERALAGRVEAILTQLST